MPDRVTNIALKYANDAIIGADNDLESAIGSINVVAIARGVVSSARSAASYVRLAFAAIGNYDPASAGSSGVISADEYIRRARQAEIEAATLARTLGEIAIGVGGVKAIVDVVAAAAKGAADAVALLPPPRQDPPHA